MFPSARGYGHTLYCHKDFCSTLISPSAALIRQSMESNTLSNMRFLFASSQGTPVGEQERSESIDGDDVAVSESNVDEHVGMASSVARELLILLEVDLGHE
ncbi:hypothetical protein QJS10_CPA16g01425 [Acorus calamus]|uniref:Uncharacterized protein n=1 Tax=Acorus calamus TaxID=4465 RepID=A0AAV9D3W5_ACOCL|nr:hypothetical protein QJS10_CPA16g01425 [Acorus calamus]